MRPSCQGNDECAAGEFCVPAGLNMSCEDREDGSACHCSVENSGYGRDVCVPAEMIAVDWCAGYFDGGSCAAAAQQQRSEEDIQFCQWIDVDLLTLDGNTCSVGAPGGQCLTIQQGFDPGCAGEPCGIGPEPLSLSNPYARFIDDGTTLEVFGVDDVFCGGGFPLGDWVRADDESLGACTFTCGHDNPCAIPLEAYMQQRSDASEDAPVDDCGIVALADPLAAWQAAHDCALQHAEAGQGFRVIWEEQGIDSSVHEAAIGLQAFAYAVVMLHTDQSREDPYVLSESPASGLDAAQDCEVAVGEICLAPIGLGPSEQLCPG